MAAHESLGSQFHAGHDPGYQGNEGKTYSPRTWIPVHQLKGLESGDWGGPVSKLHKSFIPSFERYDWHGLRQYTHGAGVHSNPIAVNSEESPTTVHNGHHRAVDAMENGRMFVPVSEDWGEEGGILRNTGPERAAKRSPKWVSAKTGTVHSHKAAFTPEPGVVTEKPQQIKGQGKLFSK
jgi:hypothetical protein